MMKKFSAFLLMILLFLPMGCDDDTPTPTAPKKTYSGTFIIEDSLVSNSCVLPVGLGYSVSVTVEGDSITFAGFGGSWDSINKRGYGVSPEKTIPVDPPTCYSHYTVTFDITYTDHDHFTGVYHVDFRHDPGCPNPNPCFFEYDIFGTRP